MLACTTEAIPKHDPANHQRKQQPPAAAETPKPAHEDSSPPARIDVPQPGQSSAEPPASMQHEQLPLANLAPAECGSLSLDDVQLALACLRKSPAGDIDPIRETLRALVKRRHRLRGQ